MAASLHQIIAGIDWPLLRAQKFALVNYKGPLSALEEGAMQGLIELLDSMQGAAITDGRTTEEALLMHLEEDEQDAQMEAILAAHQ